MLISTSNDNTVQVWDMETNKRIWQVDHGDKIWCSLLHDDKIITCCADKSVRISALESGEELHRLEHPGPCYNADLSPNKSMLAVACDSAVSLWDMDNVVKIREIELGFKIFDVRFNPSGNCLIVGLSDGEIFKIEMK